MIRLMVRAYPYKAASRGYTSRHKPPGIPRNHGAAPDERVIGEYTWSKFQDTEKNTAIPKMKAVTNRKTHKEIGTIVLKSTKPSGSPGVVAAPSSNIFRKFVKSTPKTEIVVDDDTQYDSTEIEVIQDDHSSLILVDEAGSSGNDSVLTEEKSCEDTSVIEIFSSVQKPGGSEEKKKQEKEGMDPGTIVINEEDDEEDIVCLGEVKKESSPTWSEKMKQMEEEVKNLSWTDTKAENSTKSVEKTSKKSKKSMDRFSEDCRLVKNYDGMRFWEKYKINAKPEDVASEFTLCTYNVLCQTTTLSTGYLYRHLDQCPEYLTWEYRWQGLKEELIAINADIIGLQEVEDEHYKTHYSPLMRVNGYNGHYKQKEGGLAKVDGCAIFWKPDIFDQLEYNGVNYFVNCETILDKPNVGQILVLKCRKTGEIVIIGNTHLIFNTERGDIKLAQLALFFANIHAVKTKYEKLNPSVIIFGDFNIEPNSLVYDYITTGSARIHNKMVRVMSGQSVRTGGTACDIRSLLHPACRVGLDARFLSTGVTKSVAFTENLTHSFQFQSVHSYKQLDLGETRKISTYHKDEANPDFIFYNAPQNSKDTLQLRSRLSLPLAKNLRRMKPWPNCQVPSDHIPLIAKFRLVKSN